MQTVCAFEFVSELLVECSSDTPITITAKNEIIVSGGAFGTPQLLLLSGIGPEDDLKELSITPLVNSPDVGNHLLDHTLLPNYFNVSINGTWDDVVRDSAVFNEKLQQWLDTRQGLFTDSPGNSLSYLRLPDNSSAFAGIPDPASGPLSPHTELIFVVRLFAYLIVVAVLIGLLYRMASLPLALLLNLPRVISSLSCQLLARQLPVSSLLSVILDNY